MMRARDFAGQMGVIMARTYPAIPSQQAPLSPHVKHQPDFMHLTPCWQGQWGDGDLLENRPQHMKRGSTVGAPGRGLKNPATYFLAEPIGLGYGLRQARRGRGLQTDGPQPDMSMSATCAAALAPTRFDAHHVGPIASRTRIKQPSSTGSSPS